MTGSTIERPYCDADVQRLRGSVVVEHTLARRGAQRLRALLEQEEWVSALGALTGGQAVQMVKAGLKAIYLSGWQVAADANLAGQTYLDMKVLCRVSRRTPARGTTPSQVKWKVVCHHVPRKNF